jgi:hypothetical protein
MAARGMAGAIGQTWAITWAMMKDVFGNCPELGWSCSRREAAGSFA